MARYLVTGGAGFIGAHIVRRLIANGHNVRVLDNFSTGSRSNLADLTGNLEIVEADIRDRAAVCSAVSGVDYLLHLAAQVSVPRSIDDPVATDDVNSRGTLNVLMAAKTAGVSRFVLSSSCAVYGDNPNLPLSEDLLPDPLSPYAISKLTGEYYCKVFTGLYGVPTVALRYFNVFGPGQQPDSQYAAVIPKFIGAVSSGNRPTVFGDGEQTRDFIYVENVVEANMLACRSEAAVGRVINIGSGIKTSLNQLLMALSNVSDRQINAIYKPPRSGDIKHSVADISLARQLLDFECRIGFEEGLRRTYEYFNSR